MFSYQRSVRFAETDLAGVAHFSALMILVEEAWHAWLRLAGVAVHPSVPASRGGEAAGWPVVGHSVRFRRPLHFAEAVRVDLVITRAEKGRVAMDFALIGEAGEAASGTFEVACVSLGEGGKFLPRELPTSLMEDLPKKT